MMPWDLSEDLNSPPVKTPKKLLRIVAEFIAGKLAKSVFTKLSLIFHDPTSFLYNNALDVKLVLEGFQRKKHWYWHETQSILGNANSYLRSIISIALIDIIVDEISSAHSREKLVFCTFLYQILFGHSAGTFPTLCCYPMDQFTGRLKQFFKSLEPFELVSVQDSCMVFGKPNYFQELLRCCPNLTHIFISSNLTMEVLETLRDHCKELEVLELEINDIDPVDHIENCLAQTFFPGNNIDSLLQKAESDETVEKSFQNLREVYIYSLYDFIPVSCNLMFLLQYFYPGIKTRWLCKARTVRNMGSLVQCGMPCPPFVHVSDRFYLDILSFRYDSHKEKDSLEFIGMPKFLRAEYLDFIYDPEDNQNVGDIINSLLQKYNCNKLVLEFAGNLDITLTESLKGAGDRLHELYLTGGLLDDEQSSSFFSIVSGCVNLKTLSVELEVGCDQMWQEFDPLLNLEVISLILSYRLKSKFASKMVRSVFRSTTHNNVNLAGLNGQCTVKHFYYSTVPSVNQNLPADNSKAQVLQSLRTVNQHDQALQPTASTSSTFPVDETPTLLSITRTADPLDIKELKVSSIYPARHSDYRRNLCTPVTDASEVRRRGSSVKEAKGEQEQDKAKAREHMNELASIFTEVRDIRIKGYKGGYFQNGKFGIGYYGDGSYGLGFYGNGVDGFGFYGYGPHGYGFYGYGRNGFGFYGEGPQGYGFYGHGANGYGFYAPNPRRGNRYYNQQTLGYKYYPSGKSNQTDQRPQMGDVGSYQPSRYHSMNIETLELAGVETPLQEQNSDDEAAAPLLPDPDPITTIMLSLISKAPNLKTLELPGARLCDLSRLKCKGHLLQIRTLKISNTCSPEVVEIITSMPSLALLIIDGKYGINNYFAYKSIFQHTSLRVEFYNGKFINPKSSLLDADKRRLTV